MRLLVYKVDQLLVHHLAGPAAVISSIEMEHWLPGLFVPASWLIALLFFLKHILFLNCELSQRLSAEC